MRLSHLSRRVLVEPEAPIKCHPSCEAPGLRVVCPRAKVVRVVERGVVANGRGPKALARIGEAAREGVIRLRPGTVVLADRLLLPTGGDE